MAQAVVEFKSAKAKKFLSDLEDVVDIVTEVRNAKYRKLLAIHFFKDVIAHFRAEAGPDGPWKKWSRSYLNSIAGLVAFRRIRGRVVPITSDKFLTKNKPPRKPGKKLQDTGFLRQSNQPGFLNSVSGARRHPKGALFFNNARTRSGFPYAFAHNEGGPVLPKRQFMWLSDRAIARIGRETMKFIEDEVK